MTLASELAGPFPWQLKVALGLVPLKEENQTGVFKATAASVSLQTPQGATGSGPVRVPEAFLFHRTVAIVCLADSGRITFDSFTRENEPEQP